MICAARLPCRTANPSRQGPSRSRERQAVRPRARSHLGGPGGGAVCAVCELAVKKNEMEFEIEFVHDSGNPDAGLDKYHVHIRCFAAWEFERRSAQR